MQCGIWFVILMPLLTSYCYVESSSTKSVDSCLSDCSEKVLQGKASHYQECMASCQAQLGLNWILTNDTECSAITDSTAETPACSAEDIRVLSFETKPSHRQGGVSEYVAVKWTPCPYGLNDVAGYEVQIFETQLSGYSFCKTVMLKHRLSTASIGDWLSVLFSEHSLDYSTTYQIWVEGLPKSAHRYNAYLEYRSKSCSQINGYGSCLCGMHGLETLPQPNVTIIGYSVTISLKPLPDCFDMRMYRISILSVGNQTVPLSTVDLTPNNSMVQTYTYSPVYLPQPGSQIVARYHAFSADGEFKASESAVAVVTVWKPVIMSVSVDQNDGKVEVVWICPAPYYNISRYEMRVNAHRSYTGEATHQRSYQFVAECGQNQSVIHTFSVTHSGTYSVQLREAREESEIFADVEWSEVTSLTTFVYQQDERSDDERVLILCFALLLPTLLLVAGCIAMLYCGRKGYCKKIHHRLPFSVEYLFGLPLSFQHDSKCVWIVWQADNRSSELSELHSENIRHLASYLANHCGLDVVLDQYEVFLSGNLSAWIQSNHDKAEYVIFVCPHITQHTKRDSCAEVSNFSGNFMAAFRFYEKDLLSDEISRRLITVTLPYSDKNASTAAQLLTKTTPVFKLMNDIEDLYFYIQGYPKVNRFGRHIIKNIHRRGFEETAEGKALLNGLKEMVYLQSCGTRDSSCRNEPSINLGGAKDFTDDATLAVGVSDMNSLPKNSDCRLKHNDLLKPCPPPLLHEDDDDADESMFLINTHGLLSVHYLRTQEPQAVVFDQSCLYGLPSEHVGMQTQGNGMYAPSPGLETCSSNAVS